MKRANNIIELFQNLSPIHFLTPDKEEFYVDLYPQDIKRIRVELLYDPQPNTTIYVSGQTGSGKTTALNFLPNNDIENKYIIEYFYSNQLLQLDDIDIVDVLLMLCYKLAGHSEKLTLKVGKRVTEMAQQLRSELEKTIQTSKTHNAGGGGDIEIGGDKEVGIFPRFLNFFGHKFSLHADYRFNYEKRNIARQVLSPKLEDLLALTNEIIDAYLSEKDPNNQKQLLIFLHDLNHMQNAKIIKELFIKNRYYLERLKAVKIITIPVGLRALPMFQAHINFLGLKIKQNPLTPDNEEENQAIERNKNLLRAIIEKRISEAADLIEDKALDIAIEYSGGIVRQLIDILHQAARKVIANEGDYIYEHDVREGMTGVRRKLTRSLFKKERIEILDFIRQNYASNTNDENLFIESAAANQVVVYKNDDFWYDINPLIQNTVKSHAAKLNEDND